MMILGITMGVIKGDTCSLVGVALVQLGGGISRVLIQALSGSHPSFKWLLRP